MARKEDMSNTIIGGSSSQLGIFTLNETPVGTGAQNTRRADIQLVQFFLRQFFKEYPELFRRLPTTKSNRKISIDGDCGGQTKTGILVFQNYIKAQGGSIKADGLVSVAHSFVSSISHTAYTIHNMNHWFLNYGDGKEHHGHLENHPDIIAYAPDLRAQLLVATVGDEF